MNCPNCGNPEQARVKVCPSCGTAYASQDLINLRQLEFLLQVTATWPETESLQKPYTEQLEALRARLLPPRPTEEVVNESFVQAAASAPISAPQPTIRETPVLQVTAAQAILAPGPAFQEAPAKPAAAPDQPPPPPAHRVVTPPQPKKEAVSFDQWLLSERNIKIALYTGGLLLIIAGLIFVGANWSRMAGWAKFAVLVAITIGMYVGGALLFKRRNLRLGGVALLAIASGFLLLDLVVLQIYEFRQLGLDDRVMWLICSILALLVYLLTAYWTRASLFVYLSIAAIGSAVTAVMSLLNLTLTVYPLVYQVLAICLLLMARGVRSTRIEKLAHFPLLIVSQISTSFFFLTSLVLWRLPIPSWEAEDQWLALAAMSVGVLFYILTDLAFHWAFARWVTMGTFGLVTICTLVQLNFTITAICFTLMLLALAYLFLGFYLHKRTKQIDPALPFLAGAQVAAPLIFLVSLALWAGIATNIQLDNPWFALATLAAGMLFYVITDLLFQWILARWAAAVAFFMTVFCILIELNVPAMAILMVMMILAIGYLFVGLVILRRSNQMDKAMPLIAVAQAAVLIAFLSSYLLWSPYGQVFQAGNPWFAIAAMLAGVVFYITTDLLYHWILARWAAALAFGATAICTLVQLNVEITAMGFILMLLALAYLMLGFVLYRRTNQFDRALPLLVVSHLAAPTLYLFSLAFWAEIIPEVRQGPPWFALTTMLVGVLFYITSDLLFHWILARWAAAFAFAVTVICMMVQLHYPPFTTSFTLLVVALAFILGGFVLRQRTKTLPEVLPLYAAGYAIALYTTFQAALTFDMNPLLLANVLVGDGFLLVISAIIHRQVPWAYGAAWLFIAPVTIYAQVYLPGSYQIGLTLFALLIIYAAAGFLVSRRNLKLGGAFLSAAAFLSLVVAPLVWTIPLAATLILGVIAALYLLFAIWLGWIWLLLPMLAAVHLAVFSGLDIFLNPGLSWTQVLTMAYGILGITLILIAVGLRRLNQRRWAWLLIAFALLDLAGSYMISLVLGGWIAILLSGACAALAFWLAWEEKQIFTKVKLPPVLTYLGVLFVFIGHLYLLAYMDLVWTIWPPFTAACCALLVIISWMLRQGEPSRIFGIPLHRSGLVAMLLPLITIVIITNTSLLSEFDPNANTAGFPATILQMITFGIASAIYFAEAAIRRNPILAYVGGGACMVVIWSGLMYFRVDELQAYIVPLGLELILIGWSERRLGRRETYRWVTLGGLLILMGSAFYQSIDSAIHAALLLGESLLALGWGIRIHSRGFVVMAGIALLANAVAQLGPAFIELPRWVQIGVIGSLLLGGGLFGLFRRDQIITARRRFTEDWKKWQP